MNSARSRANTEPDAKLKPSEPPSRPVSSFEFKRVWKEPEAADPEVIKLLARFLNVPLDVSLDIGWVVRDCHSHLLEEGWECKRIECIGGNDLVFQHIVSGEKRSEHDIAINYRRLAERILCEHRQLEMKRRNLKYQLQEIVYVRISRASDVRLVAAPEVVACILRLLKVDIMSEFFLARIVKEEMDAAYLKMSDKGGPGSVSVADCVDLQQLETRIGLERIRITRKFSPSGLIFCVECKQTMADGACSSCGDCLCACCHSRLHSRGKRQDHLFVFLEQCVCSECSNKSADIRCSDCGDLFCRHCFLETHKSSKRARHCVQLPVPSFCMNCDFNDAKVACLECLTILCLDCSYVMHPVGPRMHHTLYGIRSVVYRKKLFADNTDAVFKIIDKIMNPIIVSPWFRFFDNNMQMYWYNFLTKKIVVSIQRPKDLPEVVQAAEDLVRNRAMEHAVFDVPARIRIKFRPEIST